jgi:pimeloyl-ACP methyl ester carboxylesterase
MGEQVLVVDGVELCVEAFGSPDDPAVLLIAGGAQSMVWWEDGWCRLLAAGGRWVVRYDHRDTGRSTASPPGRPAYTGADLADDVLRVLDGLRRPDAHLVGLSMGGGLAQVVALTRPERVRSLTLVATTPLGDHRGLPGPAPQLAAAFADPDPEPDWTDRDAVLRYRVDVERPYAGGLGFDEPRVRRLAAREVDRTRDMAASMTNHFLADGATPTGLDATRIAVPVLVLHGTTDPLFPVEHGRALARLVPGARLVELDGVGHEQPPPQRWGEAAAAVLARTDDGPGRGRLR